MSDSMRQPLRDVCEPVTKVDPSCGTRETITYIDISSIDRGRKVVSDPKVIAAAAAPSRARQPVRAGDVLISTVRPNLKTIARVSGDLDAAIASTGFCVLRPGPRVDPNYLFWAIQDEALQTRLIAKARGVSYPAIRDVDVMGETIPVPPLDEQRAIVAAIEDAFARIDVIEAELDAVGLAQVRFVKALLRDALLAGRGPMSGPSPYSTVNGWRTVAIGEIGEVRLGRQRSPKYHSGPQMRPYLRVANVFEDRIDTGDIMSMTFTDAEFETYRLQEGDILLNEGQSPEMVGRPAMYRGSPPDVAFTNSLVRFRPGDAIDGEFALMAFRAMLHNGRFKQEARITTNIAHLSASRFAAIEIVLPPLAEQRNAVAEATRHQDMLRGTSLLRDQVLALLRSLRASVLHRAFTGELSIAQTSDKEGVA